MQIFYDLNENFIKSTSLALGFFDGLHQGHRKVLLDIMEKANKYGTESAVLTFSNHPVEVLWGTKPEFITTIEERLELFKSIGIQNVFMLKFTPELAHMNACEYLQNIILKLNPKSITIGYNHFFGSEKSGNESFLRQYSKDYGYEVFVISPVTIGGQAISSTLIRNLIKEGHTFEASQYLGRMYKIKNMVIKGEQRGRIIGYPTANIQLPESKIIPSFGVYLGITRYKENDYRCIINIGLRPTFSDIQTPLAEVHLLDFNQDIYGEEIEVSFYKKIRDEKKFDSIELLKNQISDDVYCLRNEMVV